MAEYSRLAKGHFTSTGGAQTIYLPFTPDSIQWWNYTEYATAGGTDSVNVNGYWDASMGQGFAIGEFYSSGGALITDIVTSSGVTTFGPLGATNSGLMLQLGAQIQIVAIPKASPTVITVTGLNHYSVGQVVLLEGLFQTSTTGMPQMAGIPFVITAVGTSGGNQTITVTWNSNQSNYTALSGSPTGAFVRQVLFPWNYLPGVVNISSLNLSGTNVVVTTTNNHNFVVGQEIAFRIPSAWGSTQLNALPNSNVPGSPTYYYVTALGSNTSFTCTALSSGVTAFNSNPTVAQTVGLTPPQVLAMGDVNSGGVAYSGGALYPSPIFPTSSSGISTINGPAISGAFVNNTAQGFVIGNGVGVTVSASTATICGQSGDVVYWKAYFSDYSLN